MGYIGIGEALKERAQYIGSIVGSRWMEFIADKGGSAVANLRGSIEQDGWFHNNWLETPLDTDLSVAPMNDTDDGWRYTKIHLPNEQGFAPEGSAVVEFDDVRLTGISIDEFGPAFIKGLTSQYTVSRNINNPSAAQVNSDIHEKFEPLNNGRDQFGKDLLEQIYETLGISKHSPVLAKMTPNFEKELINQVFAGVPDAILNVDDDYNTVVEVPPKSTVSARGVRKIETRQQTVTMRLEFEHNILIRGTNWIFQNGQYESNSWQYWWEWPSVKNFIDIVDGTANPNSWLYSEIQALPSDLKMTPEERAIFLGPSAAEIEVTFEHPVIVSQDLEVTPLPPKSVQADAS